MQCPQGPIFMFIVLRGHETIAMKIIPSNLGRWGMSWYLQWIPCIGWEHGAGIAYSLEMVFHDHLHQEYISAVVAHVTIPEHVTYLQAYLF